MCGRYTLTLSLEALQKTFPNVKFHIEHTPRFNIAPTQMIPAIREELKGTFGLIYLNGG